ncbi:hypothetical protein [Sporichthya polymorpha]|uniref:hypothetical protein n=1 Tax=Sporichthya polymorpha TaxID=35751 RepID=UPI000376C736|nr:hypothetical protein [Sporichthya polymorpha]
MTEQIEAEYAPPATVSPAPAPAPALESPVLESAALRAERERLRRARVAYEAKLSRLRLYSYCLTLTSCVLALMSFMYLAQGAADGDPTFTGLGVGFVAATVATLWFAVRITHVTEFAAT